MSTDHREEHPETWRWNTGLIWVPSPDSRSVVTNVMDKKVLHMLCNSRTSLFIDEKYHVHDDN